MHVQGEISSRRLTRKLGTVQRVLVDEVGATVAVGRSRADAPEIDGVVRIRTRRRLAPGDFVDVRVTETRAHDLVGVPA
jgi:ribosomal protein S12 methylthiotransferase